MPPSRNTRSSKNDATVPSGAQASSSREASSSRGLQANTPPDSTRNGVVTRSSTRKSQSQTPQEDPAQRPSKGKGKSKDNSTSLRELFWIFYHKSAWVPECLSVTEDLLDKRLSDVYPLFASKICKRYRVNVDEETVMLRPPRQTIKLRDINSGWMKSMLSHLGPFGADEFMEQSQEVFDLLPSYITIGEVFEFVSKEDRVLHLVVTADIIRPGDSNAPPQEEEPAPLPIFVERFVNNVERGLKGDITCPSKAARSEQYIREQKDTNNAIYDGRRGQGQDGCRIAPPIQIFHPVFESFYHYLHDSTMQPSQNLIRMTHKFMEEASIILGSEDTKNSRLRERLSNILNLHFMTVGEKARPDGSVWLTIDGVGIPLVIMEAKREYGEGGCDPATQASFSFRSYCTQNVGLRNKCCCPTFIIAVGGPWLALLGGVFTDKYIVQRLTELSWTAYSSTYEDVRVYWLARIFNALLNCLGDLDRYYRKLNEDKFAPSDYFSLGSRTTNVKKFVMRRLFPYPRIFTEEDEHGQVQTRKFRYIKPLEAYSTCVTFAAEICHDDDSGGVVEKIVVKFVAQYGEGVHRFLAKEGDAPRLRYIGPLLREDGTSTESPWWSSAPHYNWAFPGLYFGQVRMVVMDYVERVDLPITPERGEQVWGVLKKLHTNGFVFGDLRVPNVIFTEEDKKIIVKFIDFDWSGRYKGSEDGSVAEPNEDEKPRYPLGLSNGVRWPMDLDEIELHVITPEHDKFMLKEHFNYSPPNTNEQQIGHV